MTEFVTITPDTGRDSDGNPQTAGTPFDVAAFEVAPGNTLDRSGVKFSAGGDGLSADFTAYLPLRARVDGEWVSVAERATDTFFITLRGKKCRGQALVWTSGGRGGVAVLARSATGKAS